MIHEALSLLELMPAEAMLVGAEAQDWREAIRAAGDGLVRSGATTDDYTDQMIETVEKLGPYIVIAPGLALAHARPSAAVLRTGLSWAGLARPVEFGHAHNDPVRLVVGLAGTDHAAHSTALAQLAQLMSTPGALDALTAAPTVSEVRNVITDYERSTS